MKITTPDTTKAVARNIKRYSILGSVRVGYAKIYNIQQAASKVRERTDPVIVVICQEPNMNRRIIVFLAFVDNDFILARKINGRWNLPSIEMLSENRPLSELIEIIKKENDVSFDDSDFQIAYDEREQSIYVAKIKSQINENRLPDRVGLQILFEDNWNEAAKYAVDVIKRYPEYRELFSFLETDMFRYYSDSSLAFIKKHFEEPIRISKFESPDIIYETKENIIGIEEFKINASAHSKKGYVGLEKIKEMERELKQKACSSLGVHVASRHIDYSARNLLQTFVSGLRKHHDKMPQYRRNIEASSDKQIIFGFMVTDTTYMGSFSKKLENGLFMCNITEFWDIFYNYADIDFFIFRTEADPKGGLLIITRKDKEYLLAKREVFNVDDCGGYFFSKPHIIETSVFIPYKEIDNKQK